MSILSILLGPGGDAPCDFLIPTADGSEFSTHRSFLCRANPFLRVALGPEYGSSKWPLLKGVSAADLGLLLVYYDMGELRIDNNNVAEVLAAADMLLMDEARDLGQDYVLKSTDIDDCLGMAQPAQDQHWPRFHDNVFSFVREHFDAAWRRSSAFQEVPAPLLVELFSSSELNVRDEVDLLFAIRRWFTRSLMSAAELEASLPFLLQCSRVGLCSETTLNMFRRLCPTFAKTRAYRATVRGDLRRGPCKCSASLLLLRCCDDIELQVCIALGSLVSESDEAEAVPSRSTERWVRNRALFQFRCVVFACTNPECWPRREPHELYMVGGCNSRVCRVAVKAYGPRASLWLLHTMHRTSPRTFLGVVVAVKFIYTEGGIQAEACLHSCDCFNIERCVWEPFSAMHVARGYVPVAAMNEIYAFGGENGKLYVSGGNGGHVMLSSVEVYTPSSKCWLVVQRMPGPRGCHRMKKMNGRINIVGGYGGSSHLSTSDDNELLHKQFHL